MFTKDFLTSPARLLAVMIHILRVALTLAIAGPLSAIIMRIFTFTLTLTKFTRLLTMVFHVVRIVLAFSLSGPHSTGSHVIVTVAFVRALVFSLYRFSNTQTIFNGLAFQAQGRTALLVWLLANPVTFGGVEADKIPGVLGSSGQIATCGTVAANLVSCSPYDLDRNQKKYSAYRDTFRIQWIQTRIKSRFLI